MPNINLTGTAPTKRILELTYLFRHIILLNTGIPTPYCSASVSASSLHYRQSIMAHGNQETFKRAF